MHTEGARLKERSEGAQEERWEPSTGDNGTRATERGRKVGMLKGTFSPALASASSRMACLACSSLNSKSKRQCSKRREQAELWHSMREERQMQG